MSYLPVELGEKPIPNFIYHPIKEKKIIDLSKFKKYCVISAVGKNSLHREWIKKEADFDLHLIIYDNSYNKFYKDTDFISYKKGYKFKLVYDYLQKHPEYLNHYEYFFVPDDDISIDSVNISKLFRIMEECQQEIAQPALSDSYYTYEHTIKQKGSLLRYSNFVEMMAPCFSSEAMQKVLFTFNENISGWGIEFHWSKLIGFTGKEMAIIDDIHCVHTRPIQSNNSRNYEELNAYLCKYNLNRNIVETGIIPMCNNNDNANWFPVIVDKGEQKQIISHLDRIAYQLSAGICRIASVGLSEGRLGISLFFFNYYRLSGKRKYYDIAMAILESIYDSVGNIANDFSFSNGLSGVSSTIEYLSQEGFVDENTDEILEDICIALNENQISSLSIDNQQTNSLSGLFENDLTIKEITGYGMHYVWRMRNSNHNPNKNAGHLLERFILIKLIDLLDSRFPDSLINSDDLFIENQKNDNTINNPESLVEIIRFLIQAQTIDVNYSKLESILEKFIPALYCLISSKIEKDLYQKLIIADTLYNVGQISNNPTRKQDAITIVLETLNWDENRISNLIEIRDIQVAYLYNRFYQNTLNKAFQKASIDWIYYCLSGKIGSKQKQGGKGIVEKLSAFDDFGFHSGLANVGLALIASIADFDTNWDKLIQISYFSNPSTKYAFVMSESEKILFANTVKETKEYLEFGMGGSTIYMVSETHANINSVESSEVWINIIKEHPQLQKTNEDRLNLFYINTGATGDWGVPLEQDAHKYFPNYSSSPFKKIKKEKIDTVLIDGRFRVACTLMTIIECSNNPNLRILIHDFWNREQYHIVLDFLDVEDRADTLGLFRIKKNIDLNEVKGYYESFKYNPA